MGIDIDVCERCHEGYLSLNKCFVCDKGTCDNCVDTRCLVCPCEHTNHEDVNHEDAQDLCDNDNYFDPTRFKNLWTKRCICKGCKCVNHICMLVKMCYSCIEGKEPLDNEIAGRMFMESDKTLEEVADFLEVQLEPTRRALTDKPYSCPLKRKCAECKSLLGYDELQAKPKALVSVGLKITQTACEPCVTLRGINQVLPPDLAYLAYDYLAPETVSQKRKRACRGCKRPSKRRKLQVHTCRVPATLSAPQ